MREGYTSQAKKALAYAVRTAEKCGHNYVGTEHLLIGLLNVEDGTAGMVLSEFHVDAGQLTELIDRLIAPGGNTVTESRPDYTPRVRRVLENAEAEAARFKSRAVGTEHLLIAILKESDCVATRLLFTMGINIQKLYGAILTAMGEAPLQGGASGNANTGRGPQTRGGAQTSETPALDQYSRDLTELAREGKLDPVVGRGQEIERVIQILSRRTKNNPCLIGEPGVGKTAIAEGLAQRIALGIVPETIRDKRVVVLDLSGMVAGSKYRGEFEERIKRVVKEVTDNENILLFIDELHTIIGAGGAEGALDASNILKPSLSRGEIQLIGATTLEEYRKYIEKDAALERRFQPVKVEEPTESEALDILKGLRPYYERHHGVEITDEALEAAVKMSVRYINDRFLPDKAIDLVDEASAGVQLAGYQVPDNMTKEEQALFDQLESDPDIKEWMPQYRAAITAVDERHSYEVNLTVSQDYTRLTDFISLQERVSRRVLTPEKEGAIITEKLGTMLGLKAGDTLTLRDGDNRTYELAIAGVSENYASHFVYISAEYYEEVFGKAPEYNTVIVDLADRDDWAAASEKLLAGGTVQMISSDAELVEQYKNVTDNLGYVVAVLIVSAGLLAFVVQYNLSNINITERTREIATLKVLGFYDGEVSAYIYRESVILTILGTGLGLLLGTALTRFVVATAEVDSIMFGRSIYWPSFLMAALITFLFSFLVNWVMHYRLKKINMVESMKSVD